MFRSRTVSHPPTHTRTIHPKLGLLGFLGLLGCLGFLPLFLHFEGPISVPFPFFFFAFFGFFAFYYEGKMSGTLMDERFQANTFRAAAVANRTGLALVVLVAILSISVLRISNPYTMLSLLIATIGFAFGLSVFLSQYLLYRYEHEE